MSGPRNTEPQANGALARALRRRNPGWNDNTVHAERTHVIQQAVPGTGTGKRPDILIAPPRRQPVIVETEFACAFYLFIRQPMGRKSALRREIPWILRGFQGRLSC